jgi:type II secretory pathway pseudopilin PulG
MRNPSESVSKSVLPTIALILVIAGFCVPPLLLVGLVLAIVALARSGEPAFAPGRTFAIVSLVLSLLAVPMWGIAAAIAIPAFVKYPARSKQSECKVYLKAAYTAEMAYYGEYDQYSTTLHDLGFSVEKGNRYLYRFAPERPLGEVGVAPDPAKAGATADELEAALPPNLQGLTGVRGTCPACDVTVMCIGNLDLDPELDVWSISTAARRTMTGQVVGAGVPWLHLNDVNDSVEPELEADPRPGQVMTRRSAQAEPEAREDENSWVSYSNDGKTTLRQRASVGQCTVECQVEGSEPAWTTNGACLSVKGERRYVAPDCQRTVVLVPAPDRGKSWAQTTVMRVYAGGKLEYAVSGVTVLPEKYMQRSPSWLQGCFGVPGDEPHYSEDGRAVEYTTVDGKPGRVSLFGEPKVDAPTPTRRKQRH